MLRYIAAIENTYGYKGEIIIGKLDENLKTVLDGTQLNIGFSEKFNKPYILEHWDNRQNKVIIKLVGVNSDKDALNLKDMGIFVDDSLINSDDESYYVDDLIGCRVFDNKTNKELGIIKDVLIMPANDVWIVDMPEGELPIPYIEDVVKKVEIDSKIVSIELIDGLMDLLDEKPKKNF
jgi:16S rRNA processing protein RimM